VQERFLDFSVLRLEKVRSLITSFLIAFFSISPLGSYVKDWPRPSSSPPDPGLFADCFDVLLRDAVGQDAVLTLFVKSLDRGYFDELSFIKDCLIKEHGKFLLLSHHEKDEKYPRQRIPDLFFEWSSKKARFMVSEWFMSPQVSIEGYVSGKPILAEISLWSSLASDRRAPRELLDYNGYGIQAVARR
jgi:hypothetical protein